YFWIQAEESCLLASKETNARVPLLSGSRLESARKETDSGSAAPVPSLHCQKIARAKWDFLFGTSADETAGKRNKSKHYTL
ncbi:hypothetical protein ATANTOWER_015946, partial [Ataeniobius toweri]|nr:hypothetical protein [Ataeniobius toweri]